ncbi:hypothetical protein [Georgenia wangjunii]|uniref:hypothetical protein n=1 Tax=Georgenia wangjunii TaxID=3117730 RepID=UPI002F25F075
MRGDERRVVDAFCQHLVDRGWHVRREVDFCDVVARRGSELLYAEAKGRTSALGLDVDTLFGQLLRRMPIAEDTSARFAVVVPTSARTAALRVPEAVRALLRIDVYVVDDEGAVALVE